MLTKVLPLENSTFNYAPLAEDYRFTGNSRSIFFI